jgi:hypothetical protein
MVQIELTEGERETLRAILQKHFSELSWEIAFTHEKASLEFLQKRKEFLEGFIQRLNK